MLFNQDSFQESLPLMVANAGGLGPEDIKFAFPLGSGMSSSMDGRARVVWNSAECPRNRIKGHSRSCCCFARSCDGDSWLTRAINFSQKETYGHVMIPPVLQNLARLVLDHSSGKPNLLAESV